MALPYPEGEVYFKRSALVYGNVNTNPKSNPEPTVMDDVTGPYPDNFWAEKAEDFYSHVLIEHVWNKWASGPHTEPYNNDNMPKHPRSELLKGYGSNYWTQFGVWNNTYISFGDKKDGTAISREVCLENNQNYNELRDLDNAGHDSTLKTILRPVPRGKERYMYLDLVQPFRAIYFPLAHQTGPYNRDMCTYLMVDFRVRKGQKIHVPETNEDKPLVFSDKLGLDYRHLDTLCFDIEGIYAYLALPLGLRNVEMGLYQASKTGDELITLFDCRRLSKISQDVKDNINRPFKRSIDLSSIINMDFGVDVAWNHVEYKFWVTEVLEHAVITGVGMVPGIGTLLSVCLTIGIQAITDPDSFTTENILNLSVDALAAIKGSADHFKKHLVKIHDGKTFSSIATITAP